MANTIGSNINANFVIMGQPKYLYGKLAADYDVGSAVYESSAGTFTAVDADTGATLNYKPLIVGHKSRILSTGAQTTIDTGYPDYATLGGIPILRGFDGYGQFVCKIEDPAADVFRQARFVVSDTEGVYEALSAVAAAAAGDTEAAFTNVNQLATGDLFMKAEWDT